MVTRRLLCSLFLIVALAALTAMILLRHRETSTPASSSASEVIPAGIVHYLHKDGRIGVADEDGNIILPVEYGLVEPYYTVENGEEKLYFWVSYTNSTENSFAMLLDWNGKALCEPVYEFYCDDLMRVSLGFVSSNVVFAIKKKENEKSNAVILYTDGMSVDTGFVFWEPIFYEKDLNLVKIIHNGKTVLWNIDKRTIERPVRRRDKLVRWGNIYHRDYDITSEENKQKNESGKWCLVDEKTRVPLTEYKYEGIRSFPQPIGWNGVFPAKLNGKWGLFKLDGTVVLPPEYDAIDGSTL